MKLLIPHENFLSLLRTLQHDTWKLFPKLYRCSEKLKTSVISDIKVSSIQFFMLYFTDQHVYWKTNLFHSNLKIYYFCSFALKYIYLSIYISSPLLYSTIEIISWSFSQLRYMHSQLDATHKFVEDSHIHQSCHQFQFDL